MIARRLRGYRRLTLPRRDRSVIGASAGRAILVPDHRSAEAVEFPHHKHIEPAALAVLHHHLEGRTPRHGRPRLDIARDDLIPLGRQLLALRLLVRRFLIVRRDALVDGDPRPSAQHRQPRWRRQRRTWSNAETAVGTTTRFFQPETNNDRKKQWRSRARGRREPGAAGRMTLAAGFL
jgi:hypothetical protein